MHTDTAHSKWWQVSELIFGIPLLVAIVLEFVVPLSFPVGPFRPAVIAAGVLLILAGITLVVLARREFARHGERTDPGQPTHSVMTSGVFSFTRNPLYLGIVVFVVGAALAFDLPWVLVLLIPSVVACHSILIAPEERYLASKFGEEYLAYTRSVRRWIGRGSSR
jgi:protein-S-isoprenylcysteine O-methyltransferase Ste14